MNDEICMVCGCTQVTTPITNKRYCKCTGMEQYKRLRSLIRKFVPMKNSAESVNSNGA